MVIFGVVWRQTAMPDDVAASMSWRSSELYIANVQHKFSFCFAGLPGHMHFAAIPQ